MNSYTLNVYSILIIDTIFTFKAFNLPHQALLSSDVICENDRIIKNRFKISSFKTIKENTTVIHLNYPSSADLKFLVNSIRSFYKEYPNKYADIPLFSRLNSNL